MSYLKKIILLYFVFLTLFLTGASANIVKNIEIYGNNRITNDTIYELIEINKNSVIKLENLNSIQKILFDTNFFKDVNVSYNQPTLIIKVEENPLVDFFYIDGVLNKKREELLYENLLLGQNRVFSDSLLKSDIEKIKDIYKNAGYFDIDVLPEISKLNNNTLNVILKINRGKKYFIKRIYFIGNKYFKSSDLIDVIASSEHGWWKFLSNTSLLNQDRLDYDESLLKEFYLNSGFYDVQILSKDIDIVDSNFANISFSINSGDLYTFSNFNIDDKSNSLTDLDLNNIKNLANKRLLGIYSQKKISNLNDDIFNYFQSKNIEFINFRMFNEKDKDKAKPNGVTTIVRFDKIPSKYINSIQVKGNSITEEIVIRRELELSEGDSLSSYKLKKSEDNLKSTGIFKEIKTGVVEIKPDMVDLNILVTEQPTGTISAGVGIGSAGSTISTGINEKNLFGQGIETNFNINLGTEKIVGEVTTTIPDFRNSDNDLKNSFFAISTDYENAGYESKLIGGSLSTKFDIYEDLSLTTGLGADHDKITTSSSASTLYKNRKGNYLTLKSFYALQTDKRNKKFQPTKGYRFIFGQSLALPGSDIPYLENNLSGRYYYPITKNHTFSLKGGLETINAFNNKNVKLSNRKFLSSRQLRGFENYGVGPKDGKEHIGGNYSAYTNFSSTIPNPFPDKWNAKTQIFLDFGNVWGADYNSSVESNKIRSAAGLGVDWLSPLGPIGLTFSQTLSSETGDIEENFSFQIGSSF